VHPVFLFREGGFHRTIADTEKYFSIDHLLRKHICFVCFHYGKGWLQFV
jgi:hypothetical protein